MAAGATFAAVVSPTARAGGLCPYTCGDIDGDGSVELDDFAALGGCLGAVPVTQDCVCSDLDGSDWVDLRDYALFTLIFAAASDEFPPDCTGALATYANLTAHRPQNGNGYAPLAKIPIAEADEDDPAFGPGIRINAPGDGDPAGEDDLIEVLLTVNPPGAAFALRRSDPALRVWTTRTEQAGTEIVFAGDRTDALPVGLGQTQITLWVEWAAAAHGSADLDVEPLGSTVVKDTLTFHTFRGVVMVLGGEGQVPGYPVDSNAGTFVVGEALYRAGFDTLLFDEDVVSADGSGAAYDAVADAIQNRLVDRVAIFGYSHGGGSTYDLAERLDMHRAVLGVFTITYTSYVDSVSNNSDLDTSQELRRPPATGYHLNHYQHGTLFEDFFLDGGPVPNSNPPPTGLDIETTPWGASSTHFEVDDYIQVRSLIESTLESNTPR